MPGLRVNPDLSAGNIITILTLIVGLTAGWFALQQQVQDNTARIERNEADTDQEMRLLRTEVRSISDRAQETRENALGQQVELTRLLTEMQGDIKFLRQTVEQLATGDSK